MTREKIDLKFPSAELGVVAAVVVGVTEFVGDVAGGVVVVLSENVVPPSYKNSHRAAKSNTIVVFRTRNGPVPPPPMA